MGIFIENGIHWIVTIQAFGPWLELPMRFFTFLGSEEFFLIVLPVLYWSVDSTLGLRVGLILVFSNGLNNILKLVFAGPRPYWVSTQVKPFAAEVSFGAPSGHAQSATSFWGTVAGYYKKTWGWVSAAALVILIGFSRMYLGVHFPHDVFLGWLFGGITLWAFLRFWDSAEKTIKKISFGGQVSLAFGVSLLFVVLGYLMKIFLGNFSLAAEWMTNALRAGAAPDPLSLSGIVTTAGTLFGISFGAAWMNQYQTSGPLQKRVLRYIVGLIGVLIFWLVLGQIFPRGENPLSFILRFVRYTLVGCWVTGGAPWLFEKVNLAEKNATS